MKKYTFYIGLNDKDTKKQIVDTDASFSLIEKWSADVLWWATISEWRWVFKHEDGTIVCENCIIISTLCFDNVSNSETCSREKYINFAKKLKKEFNQESILMEVTDVDVDFI